MKILVFGASGMLGRYVCSRMSKEHSVAGLTRNELNLLDIKKSQLEATLELYQPEIVINCAGIIKSRSDIADTEFIYVNSIFPRLLAKSCKEKKIKMFHISTDCVYDGLRTSFPYTETDHHTATDIYGKSKSLGENEDCCVIRTSIVGEEIGQTRSLISWAKSQKAKTIQGYMNHWWNGVSCLQLADFLYLMLKDDVYWTGVRHVFSPNIVNKYELVKQISDVWDLNLNVDERFTDTSCFRALGTNNEEWNEYLQLNIPDLKEQLVKMKDFKLV